LASEQVEFLGRAQGGLVKSLFVLEFQLFWSVEFLPVFDEKLTLTIEG